MAGPAQSPEQQAPERPDGWWAYPAVYAVAVYVIGFVPHLAWWAAPAIGVVLAALGRILARHAFHPVTHGENFSWWAQTLGVLAGLAAGAWLTGAQLVGGPLVAWPWLVYGSAALGLAHLLLLWVAPSAARVHSARPFDYAAEVALQVLYQGILKRAGSDDVRVTEVVVSPSGGVESVHITPVPPVEGEKPRAAVTRNSFTGRLPTLVVELDQTLRKRAKPARIDDQDVHVEQGRGGSEWIMHVTVARPLETTTHFVPAEAPQPWCGPKRCGRYEDDKPMSITFCDEQEGAADGEFVAMKGGGKALDLQTPIPTPTGWTVMGALRDGDEVFDERGRVCRVVKAHDVLHHRRCYEVVFSDGERITADAGHLWVTENLADRQHESLVRRTGYGKIRPGRVRTTEEIRATLYSKGQRNHSVRVTQPLDLPDAELPVPPYVLGAWLGDGSTRSSAITTADGIELREILAGEGYRCGHNIGGPQRTETFTVYGLVTQLRTLGVFGAKRIPSSYLRSSEKQRRALLAGLLDTDGTVCNHGRIQFDSTIRELADDVRELALSLGYRPTLQRHRASYDGRTTGASWRVSFTTADPVFRLLRKSQAHAARSVAHNPHRTSRRSIVDVRPVPSRPVRCITVDSTSQLYLAGRAMIPTHNTGALNVIIARHLESDQGEVWLVGTNKLIKMARPWLEPWLRGEAPKPAIDWVGGEGPNAALRALASAYQYAVECNRKTKGNDARKPSRGKGALLVVLEEAPDLLERNGVTIVCCDGVKRNASQLAAKLQDISRSAPVELWKVSQNALFDSFGSDGAKQRRNIGIGIAGKCKTPQDAQRVIPGLLRANPTLLRNQAVFVEQLYDEPREVRARFDFIEDARIHELAVRYTPWRHGLDPDVTKRMPFYADRWNPEWHAALIREIEAEGLVWPAAPTHTEEATEPAHVDPQEEPAVANPTRDPAELIDLWALFEQETPDEPEEPDAEALNPSTLSNPDPSEMVAGFRKMAEWVRNQEAKQHQQDSGIPDPLGIVSQLLDLPNVPDWVSTELLTIATQRVSAEADEETRRRAVEQFGRDLTAQDPMLTSAKCQKRVVVDQRTGRTEKKWGYPVEALRAAAERARRP